ncbi:MAG: hypothetical protein V7646_1211 [Pseudonocardia sp.]|jgi:hypothetical protein
MTIALGPRQAISPDVLIGRSALRVFFRAGREGLERWRRVGVVGAAPPKLAQLLQETCTDRLDYWEGWT